MKTRKLLTLLAFLILLSTFMLGCDDNEPAEEGPTSVQFESKQETIAENSSETLIRINLSKPAPHVGIIQVNADTLLKKYFVTVPPDVFGTITLPVSKGATSASFTVKPTDNSIVDGNKLATFRIEEVSEGFISGNQTSFSLAIQDDDAPAPIQYSYVNFVETEVTLNENELSGRTLQIHVSEGATASGSITVQSQSGTAVYGTDYLTEPAFSNGSLELVVQPGTNVVSFKVIATDNTVISGDFELGFTIGQTSGNISKGTRLTQGLAVKDDELFGMPMGYETSGGGWGMRRKYEYNANGNVSRILWENRTPYLTSGVDTYYYDAAEQLVRINTGINQDTKFYWENGKIIKQEKLRDNVVRSYIEYGYDEQGNVGSYRTFYLQPDNSFALSDVTLLLYYTDGNLYKKIVYYPTFPEVESIISETTFDHYLDEENPFPIVQVLPTIKTQKKLPRAYRLKANGQDLLYNLTYEFREDGKVAKRTATRNGVSTDIAVYHYY